MALTIDELNIQIVAETTSATNSLDGLIGRLKTLRNQLNGLGTAGKQAGKGLKETANGAEKFEKNSDKAGKSTKSFTDKLAQQISKTRTLYGAFKNAANMMAGWFNESNEYIETLNLFNVTMGDAAPAAREYAEAVQEAMGIDSKDFMQYQGVFKNLTAGFGVSAEQANVMSQNLTQLSYDMASFFNATGGVEEAFDKLSSAMAGQVKGLRDYGIDTTVATLQEYALSKGIETKVRSMTQAEKALLRYNYIMEQSTHIQRDMARTLITPANALRVLEAQLTRMKRAFGNIVSVIVTQVIPYVQVMVEVITEAAEKLARWAGFSEGDFAADTSNIKSSWNSAEEGVDDYSDSLKKAKKQMMGFDELNIISNPNSDSSDSGSGASGGLGDMKPIEYNFLDGLAEKTEELKARIKQTIGEIAGIAGGAMLAIGAILTFTGINVPLGLGLMVAGISGVSLAIDWAFLENPFGSTLATLEGLVGGSLLALGGILAFTGASVPLGVAFILAGATALMSAVAINWDSLSPNIKKTLATISGVVGSSLLVLGALLAFTGVAISLGVGFIAAGAISIGTAAKLNWDSSTNKVSAVITTIGSIVGGAFLALGALLAFTGVAIPLGIGLMAVGATTLFAAVAPNWNGISDKTKKTVSIISACVGGALLALGAILLFTGAGIPLGLGLLAAGGVSLASAIAPNWNAIVEKMKSIGKKIGEVWDKVWAGLKVGFKALLNGLIGLANGWIKHLNNLLAPIRLLVLGIAKAFGANITFDDVKIPSIPYLASGGVVNEGQMFIAREAGPELVGSIGRKTAVANNDQIISGIESGVYRAMVAANANSNGGGTQTIRIINEIDGDIVGEKVIKYHNGKVMQTGASPLLV